MRRKYYRCVVSVLAVVMFMLSVPGRAVVLKKYGELTLGSPEFSRLLDSEDALERREVQIYLINSLDNLDEPQRSAEIQKLIDALPLGEYNAQIGICTALGSVNFFWTATDHENAKQRLYEFYLTEQNVRLKDAIDRALMKAKGLYRDAINDYNMDEVGPSVEEKFRTTFEKYPQSSYAPMAHFYLGRYYTRSYFILRQQNRNPTLELIGQSNTVFEEFLDRVADGTYQPRPEHVLDARYFRALNFVLLDQIDRAIVELKAIEADPQATDDAVHVYQVYYSKRRADVVDEYFQAAALAQYTRDYLEKNGNLPPDDLKEFLENLPGSYSSMQQKGK